MHFTNARFRRNFQGNAAQKIALTINSASFSVMTLSLSHSLSLSLSACIETNIIYIIICKFLELSCLLSACPILFLVVAVCLNLVSFLLQKIYFIFQKSIPNETGSIFHFRIYIFIQILRFTNKSSNNESKIS